MVRTVRKRRAAPVEIEPPASATVLEASPREADLATQAYHQIRAAILDLTYEPGQQLLEANLARQLGVSRTPVREAIRRLQSEGLVETSPSRGVVVAQVSIDDVQHAYQVLEVLEGLSSRLAAGRLTDEAATTLRDILARMRLAADADDVDRWSEADADLHDHIRVMAANPKLRQVARLTYAVIERVRNIFLREDAGPDRLRDVTAEHLALGETILSGDGEGAEAQTRRLFAQARQDNVRLLRQWIAPLRRSF
jgi:DNA-binding GntR family transcriptional regulator